MAFPLSSRRRAAGDPVEVFLRFVLPYVVEERALRLPEKFSLKYGEELSSTVTISLPDGSEYAIGLKKVPGSWTYLEQGWPDLMAAHSIRLYYYLVFEYLGDSRFRLAKMFDRSCCVTPLHRIGDQQQPVDPNQSGASAERKNKESGSTSGTKTPRSYAERSFRNGEGGDVMKQLLIELTAQGTITRKLSEMSAASLTAESKILAMEMMKQKLQHPSFIDVIDFAKMHRWGLLVPSMFLQKHMSGIRGKQTGENVNVELYGGGGRRWEIGIFASNLGSYYLRKGMMKFARHNSIEDGDFCLFELLEKKPYLLRVYCFHVCDCE
ncbi:B3 domain-containing transcription factor VRN1 [Linum perenne]